MFIYKYILLFLVTSFFFLVFYVVESEHIFEDSLKNQFYYYLNIYLFHLFLLGILLLYFLYLRFYFKILFQFFVRKIVGTLLNKIKEQIILAKNHGIYGFAFYYIWPTYKDTLKMPIDMIIENKNWNIKYFLILEKENKTISILYDKYKK